ncbi:MAG: hypothetical protein ACUVUQ_11465 [Thermodesulfovibrionales bacterium]
MNEFLKVIRVGLGYCHACLRPEFIVDLKLQGWGHEFSLCKMCIQSLIDSLAKYSFTLQDYSPRNLDYGERKEEK